MPDNSTPTIDLFGDDHDIPTITALPVASVVEKAPVKKVRRESALLEDPEIIELTKRASDVIDELPWKEIVRNALAESGVAFTTQDAHNRCLAIGDTFMRGVRDEFAAKKRLIAPFESGGAGLSFEDARKCMHVLLKATDKFIGQERRQHEESKKKFVDRNVASMEKEMSRHSEENSELDTRYRSMTKKLSTKLVPAKNQVPIISESHDLMKRLENRLTIPSKSLKIKYQGPTTPLQQKTAVKNISSSSPVRIPVAQTQKEKPMVVDIHRSRRLIGPIEELGAMSLDDFRRLARFPKEAVRHVREKIDNLSSQGYEFKRKGLEAWQDSEVGRLYFSILGEVIRGSTVDQVIEKQKNSGERTLTKEEFNAIMELNQAMRFA